MRSCSEELLNEVFQKKETILNAQYVSELQAALVETATILDEFETISQRRVGDIVSLEKTTVNTVSSGKNLATMVTELRKKAFKG